MKNLKAYVKSKNEWDAIFGHAPTYTFPLSQKMVDRIARDLDGELSPENLHCDGEISREEAWAKYDYLEAVYHDLEKYCLQNWLNTPMVYEL
jgi:hypothetical protein